MLAFAPQGEMKENKIGPPSPNRHVSLTYAYTPCTRSYLAQKTAFYSRLPTLQSCEINPSWRLIHDIKHVIPSVIAWFFYLSILPRMTSRYCEHDYMLYDPSFQPRWIFSTTEDVHSFPAISSILLTTGQHERWTYHDPLKRLRGS